MPEGGVRPGAAQGSWTDVPDHPPSLRYTGFFPGKRDTMGKTPVLAQDAAMNPREGDFLFKKTKNFVAHKDNPCLSETRKSKPCPSLRPHSQEANPEQLGSKPHVATKSNMMFGNPSLNYSTDSMRTSSQAFFDKLVLPQQPKGPKTMSGDAPRSMSVQDTIAAYKDAKKRLGGADQDHYGHTQDAPQRQGV